MHIKKRRLTSSRFSSSHELLAVAKEPFNGVYCSFDTAARPSHNTLPKPPEAAPDSVACCLLAPVTPQKTLVVRSGGRSRIDERADGAQGRRCVGFAPARVSAAHGAFAWAKPCRVFFRCFTTIPTRGFSFLLGTRLLASRSVLPALLAFSPSLRAQLAAGSRTRVAGGSTRRATSPAFRTRSSHAARQKRNRNALTLGFDTQRIRVPVCAFVCEQKLRARPCEPRV